MGIAEKTFPPDGYLPEPLVRSGLKPWREKAVTALVAAAL